MSEHVSGSHFHVHGPHDQELEHTAQGAHASHADRGKDGLADRIAVTTAILATVGALSSFHGGATPADATRFKNNAATKKIEASNHWNDHHAKGSKHNQAAIALLTRRIWLQYAMDSVVGLGGVLGVLARLHA